MIKMTRSINKARANIGVQQDDEDAPGNSLHKRANGKYVGTRKERRNLYSVASFLDLYTDVEINHFDKIIMVDNELLSLSELFVALQSKAEFDKNRIFYGKAIISMGFKEGMLQIDFVERGNLCVYSNIEIVAKRSNGKIVKKYLDKNEEVYVYLRGKIILAGSKEKFIPYNDLVYKYLYFAE